MGKVIALIVVGVAVAVVIGLAANSQTRAEKQFCSAVSSLQSDLTSLKNLDPGTTSKSSLQSEFSDIQNDWNDVKSAAGNVKDADMNSLDSAWSSFESAVKSIPDDASVSTAESDVSQQADALQSALKSTADSVDCSSS